ncbi:alpha/beta fold hydrolase [Puniceibacterium sp. IMCC21224]|uniref:alpha/beta fold hydrolase n=1 Tax=Puniceibacterium sp. IMCC21224 TaxID=1618204 RepID=UPI00064DEF64|nr:alpha/beta hydrolase [Puniceibacterium sp. IMCC21224]KMK67792.1 lysophospholipase [Puniceibacterium sp. IMCC21224]
MDLTPAPFLAELAQGPEGGRAVWIHADDGVRLRLGHFPAPPQAAGAEGSVLLFPGRTEYIEKYGRTATDLAKRGYHTLTVDWRGQGLADRLLDDPLTGHVQLFDDYQRDVAVMVAAAQALDLPRPWHLIAHSMGGCIGLRALMRGLPVEAAVFTGPMWGIRIAAIVRPAAWALGWSSARLGLGHRYTPGTKGLSYVVAEPFESNLLTTDPESYAHMRHQVNAEPGLRLGGPSLQWLHQALAECRALARLPSPALPCLTYVGTQERIVDIPRIRARMANWPGGRLIEVESAEHEVLMEGPALRARVTDEIVAHFVRSGHARTAVSA